MNEALFREMNRRLQELSEDETTFTVVCECASVDCAARISLRHDEYEAAHVDSAQFIVIPGHAIVDIEEIVTRSERFEVVRKLGKAGEIADELDDN
jgi:hypothetical protein